MLPRVAIVGRPNVGKSAIFNRLAKRRISIVHDEAGVTRDRISAECWIGRRDSGYPYELMDTGGIGATLDDGFAQQVRAEADVAIHTADLILFAVDAREGIHPIDRDLAEMLRRGKAPVIVIANKVDTYKTDSDADEFYEFGFSELISISAAHGRNFSELEQSIERILTTQQGRVADSTGLNRAGIDLRSFNELPSNLSWEPHQLSDGNDERTTGPADSGTEDGTSQIFSEGDRRICRDCGLRLVRPTDLRSAWRSFERASGIDLRFFDDLRGDFEHCPGFAVGKTVWLNTASQIRFGWTLAHEIGHVAEKDKNSGYLDFKRTLFSKLVLESERALLWNLVADFEVYEPSQFGTEIANNILGDATGLWDSGFLSGLKNRKKIQKLALDFLENLSQLNPDLLPDSGNDGELSNVGMTEDDGRPIRDEPVKIAIVGRPNVGKSSLINAIMKDERSIVSDIAGTTRDAVDVPYERDGHRYTLIDTAGIRKRGKRDTSVEVFSVMRSERSIERADICLLVIDASSGVVSQDRRIVKMVIDANKPCIILLNKFDLYFPEGSFQDRIENFREDIGEDLFFLDYAPRLAISAKKRQHIGKIFDQIQTVLKASEAPIPTSVLNKLLHFAIEKNPPPAARGKRLKLLYATQRREDRPRPVPVPEYMLFVNYGNLLTRTYERYLENQIRDKFPMEGLPFVFTVRSRESKKASGSVRKIVKRKV